MKFGRIYELTIEAEGGEFVIIKNPLTIEFNVIRTNIVSANRATIKVWNLNEEKRRKIFHDKYNTDIYRRVELRAGYEDNDLQTIFLGNILWAYSTRMRTDWKTDIEAVSGGFGFANGFVAKTFPKDYSLKQVYQELIKTIPRTILGKIGNFDVKNSRGLTVCGNPWEEMKKLSVPNTNLFCDNEVVNIMNNNEYLTPEYKVFIIRSDTGLLETPKRGDAVINVEIIFEPRLKVGSVVELQSREKYYNGQYKIMGFNHRGMISQAVSGTLKTILNLHKPDRMEAI